MPESKFKIELSPSISIIIAGIIIAAAIVFVNRYPAAQPAAAAGAAAPAASANVPAPTAADHSVGSITAPIVIIEYSDFECPYCSMIYPTLKQIVTQSNGQIAWVMRDFPLYQIHPQALPAANAAECIAAQLGNAGWWKFADAVFANQSSIGPAYYTQLAQQFGADMTQYNSCVAASTYQPKIESQIAEAETAGGNGTPFTVILNTKTGKQYPISGALPLAEVLPPA